MGERSGLEQYIDRLIERRNHFRREADDARRQAESIDFRVLLLNDVIGELEELASQQAGREEG